jgi:hypothetical protein
MRHALIAVALVVLAGCGGWSVSTAQRSLEFGAEFTQESDEQLAPIVEQATTRCDSETETREDFVLCIEPYQPIRAGVALTRHSLRLGQAIVDAWRTGENEGESAWLPIAACIGHGLGQIAAAIRSLDLDVPGVVDDIVGWVDSFGSLVAGVCPSDIMEHVDE